MIFPAGPLLLSTRPPGGAEQNESDDEPATPTTIRMTFAPMAPLISVMNTSRAATQAATHTRLPPRGAAKEMWHCDQSIGYVF
jgi:hypothetical protein